MKTSIRALLPVLLVACLTLTACSENTVGPEIESAPAVGNATDAFGFSVVAQSLDFDEAYPLTFTRDTVSVGVTVTGYEQGQGRVELFDADGTLLYSRTLSGNVAEGTQQVMGRPARAALRFDDFTGIVALGVSAP